MFTKRTLLDGVFIFYGDSLFSIKAISDLDPSKAIIDLPVSKAEMMIPTDILRVETTIKPKDQHVSWAKILDHLE